MIRVTLRVGGGLGGILRVESTAHVLPMGTSLQAVMESLHQRLGDEVLGPSVLVAVNGRRVGEEERSAWILLDCDVVSVIKALAGG
jgi:sulfur carrier protein ThiS